MLSSIFQAPNCIGQCTPKQVINFNIALNEINSIEIYNNCGELYPTSTLTYAYSLDSVCWSCYMSYDDFITQTLGLNTDFYVRVKIGGVIGSVSVNGEQVTDYSTSIAEGFEFSYCSTTIQTPNLFNPYVNLGGAIALQQQLTETVSCMFGIPIYYFKLAPNTGSKDLTFKEYTLMDVEAVKQIKMVIADNTMPSSKPEFSDFGLDWQNDWETEISKGMFATAFGPTAQPMEGDLIYVPMMKRMWMVNEAYEEKNGSLMWVSQTFKISLVKYQEKSSVDLGDTQQLVDTFVKNKYDDLFGDQETVVAGTEATDAPKYSADNLYPVFEQDATRKYMSVEGIDFKPGIYYQKGTMIADSVYTFTNSALKNDIVYQRQYCGEDGVISFIINPFAGSIYSGTLLQCANLKINIKQMSTSNKELCELTLIQIPKLTLKLQQGQTYFVYLRWNRMMNNVEFFAAPYTHADMPPYRLQNHHYWFDIDNGQSVVSKYNMELPQETKGDIVLHNLVGSITNIKVFDVYSDNVSEILQMYPTHAHLIVNDTARKIVTLGGIATN